MISHWLLVIFENGGYAFTCHNSKSKEVIARGKIKFKSLEGFLLLVSSELYLQAPMKYPYSNL